MGYKATAVKGVTWMSAFRIVTRLATFGKIAVLARVLTPSQFGVFGIASLVLSLLEILTETGINIFVVQSERNIKEYINSAWVVSIMRGFVIGILLIIASPFIAQFFKNTEVLPVLLFLSLIPIIRGFINPAVATVQKELRFNFEFWYRTGIFLFDALVTLILAVSTRSVYSLVWGMMAGVLLEVFLSFMLIKPRPRFSLRKGYFKELFHSGKWVTLYGIFHYFAQEGDDIVVGRLLGSGSLGIYQMAYKISILPISEITDVVNRVIFPVYAKIKEDRERLIAAFYKSTAFITITSTFLGVLIFVFSEPIVLLLLGEQWSAVIPILKILAVYGILRAISGSVSSLFLGIGQQKYVTAMLFSRFLALCVTIIPFVIWFGLEGAAYSALVSVVVEVPVIVFCYLKATASLKN